MSVFSERIKALRLENEYSLRYVASQCGISKSAVGFYESGQRKPKIEVLEAFADLYNCDIEYLTGESNVRNYYANAMGYNSFAEAYAAGVNIDEALKKIPPQEPKLTEGEEILLSLFRRLPKESQALYIEALRAALKTQGLE